MPAGEARLNRNIALAKSPSRTEAAGAVWLSLVNHSIDAAAVAEALLRCAGAVFCHGECRWVELPPQDRRGGPLSGAAGPSSDPEAQTGGGRVMYKYEIILYWSNEDRAFVAERANG